MTSNLLFDSQLHTGIKKFHSSQDNAVQSFVEFMLFTTLTGNETPVTIRSYSLANHHWSKHELEISVKNIQNKKKKPAQILQKRLIFRYHKLKLVVNKCRNFLDFNLHSNLESCYSNQIMILDWHFNTETQFY